MNKTPLIITGSARHNGDTQKLVDLLFAERQVGIMNLLDFRISPYSYSGKYPPDDQFLDVVQEIVNHSVIIFATPVYWYAMSGQMKTLFDRLTDIVTINKPAGRNMRGKEIYLLAVGSEEVLPPGFEEPFALTSAYFEMQYNGFYYCRTADLPTLHGKENFLNKLYSR